MRPAAAAHAWEPGAARSGFAEHGAARSRFAEPVVALSPCVVDATATVTGSVRRQWALLRSVPLRRGPTTAAAAATTPTATTSARAGIIRTERRGAISICESAAPCDGNHGFSRTRYRQKVSSRGPGPSCETPCRDEQHPPAGKHLWRYHGLNLEPLAA